MINEVAKNACKNVLDAVAKASHLSPQMTAAEKVLCDKFPLTCKYVYEGPAASNFDFDVCKKAHTPCDKLLQTVSKVFRSDTHSYSGAPASNKDYDVCKAFTYGAQAMKSKSPKNIK